MAENERSNIKQRQAEGIAAAKMRGVKFGRPESSLPDNFQEISERWLKKELSVGEAAKICGMPTTTFFRHAKKMEEKVDTPYIGKNS